MWQQMKIVDYEGIKKIRRVRVVEYICDAAFSLALRHPVDEITAQMLFTEAEISRQTFYNHFPDKYMLFNYIFYYEMNSVLDQDSPADFITKVLPALFERNIKYYHSIANTDAANGFPNFLYTLLLDYYSKIIYSFWENKDLTDTILFSTERYAETTANAFITFLRDTSEAKGNSIYSVGQNAYAAIPMPIYPAFEKHMSAL